MCATYINKFYFEFYKFFSKICTHYAAIYEYNKKMYLLFVNTFFKKESLTLQKYFVRINNCHITSVILLNNLIMQTSILNLI